MLPERWLAFLRGWYPHWRMELRSWSTTEMILWALLAVVLLWNTRRLIR